MRQWLVIVGILAVAITIGVLAGGSNDKSPGRVDDPGPPKPSLFLIDTKVRLSQAFYGCPHQEDLDKVKEMLRAHDPDAMAAAAQRGECLDFDAGAEGTVRDISVWHASTCIRPAGNPDCVWVPTVFLEEAKPRVEANRPIASDPATPRCKALLGKVMETTAATFNRLSPSGENVFLDDPDAKDALIECPSPPLPYSVSAGTDTGHPPAAYYKFVAAEAAALTGRSSEELLPAIRHCQTKAHNSRDENDEEHLPIAEIDCTSFDRDGGSTSISVYEARKE